MDHLGLGIEISMIDGVSNIAFNIVNSFNRIQNAAESMVNNVGSALVRFEQLEGLRNAGEELSYIGENLQRFGEVGVEKMFELGKQVIETSSEFEQLRISLEALYNSNQKGDQMFEWAKQMSIKYPVQINELLDAIKRFQGAGVDIQHTLKDGYSGLDALMDLAKGLGVEQYRAIKGITEVVDTGNFRELQTGLGIPRARIEEVMGQKFSKDNTEEGQMQRYDLLMAYIEKRFGHVTQRLQESWSTLSTNFMDMWTNFKAAIGDSGFMRDFESGMHRLYDLISGHSEQVLQLANVIGSAFKSIWDAIYPLIMGVANLIMKFADFSKVHPEVAKVVVGIFALTSGITLATGLLLKFSGGIIMAISSLAMMSLSFEIAGRGGLTFAKVLESVSLGIMRFIGYASLFALGAFLAYEAWNTNFMGIRTTMQEFFENARKGFLDLYELVSSKNIDEFKRKWDSLGENMGWVKNLTRSIIELKYFIDSLFDRPVSQDVLVEAKIAGIDPSTLYELKKAAMDIRFFFEGIGIGAQTAFHNIKQGVQEVLIVLGPVGQAIKDFLNHIGLFTTDLGPEKWRAIGEAVGYVGVMFATWKGALFIIDAFKLLFSILKPIGEAFMWVFDIAKGFFSFIGGIINFLRPIIGIVIQIVEVVAEVIGAIISGIAAVLGVPVEIVVAIIAAIAAVVATVIIFRHQIAEFFVNLWHDIENVWHSVAQWFYNNVWKPISDFAMNAYYFVRGVWILFGHWFYENVGKYVEQYWNEAMTWIKNKASEAWNWVTNVWDQFKNWMNEHVGQPVMNVWNTVTSWINNKVNEVWNYISQIWGQISTWIWDHFGLPIQNAWDKIKSAWNSAVDAIWNYLTDKLNAIGSWFEKNVAQPVIGFIDKIKNEIGGDWQSIKEGFNYVVEVGKTGHIPGAATGGFIPHEGLVNLHPGEVVLNARQVKMFEDFLNGLDQDGTAHGMSQYMLGKPYTLQDAIEMKPVVQEVSPVQQVTNTTTQTITHQGVTIQNAHFYINAPQDQNMSPREFAEQILEELKRMEYENNMLTYRL